MCCLLEFKNCTLKAIRINKLLISTTRGQCYKNTMVNYHGNFKPTFSRVKMMQYITAILG
jgi:hypothetical protein